MKLFTTITTVRTLCGVAGIVVGLPSSPLSFLGAQEFMDKAAIPRPGAVRMKKEDEARTTRRRAREAAIAAVVAEAEGKPAAPDAEEESAEGEEAAEEVVVMDDGGLPPELAALLPVGAEFLGVRIPNYDENDKLISIINAEKMSRLDSEHLDLTDLVIESLNNVGKIETKIFMDRAVYDLTEKKLISRSPATIEKKPKMVMTGDKLIFEEMTNKGHMIGNVHMRIFGVNGAGNGGILGIQPPKTEAKKK